MTCENTNLSVAPTWDASSSDIFNCTNGRISCIVPHSLALAVCCFRYINLTIFAVTREEEEVGGADLKFFHRMYGI